MKHIFVPVYFIQGIIGLLTCKHCLSPYTYIRTGILETLCLFFQDTEIQNLNTGRYVINYRGSGPKTEYGSNTDHFHELPFLVWLSPEQLT